MLDRIYFEPNILGLREFAAAFTGFWARIVVMGGGPTRTRTWDRPIMSRML
jgi:hypothetical protein